jgi:PASTA domain-containing protein
MLAAPASGAPTLTFSQLVVVLSITAGAIIAAGLIVLWGRRAMDNSGGVEPSLVRSWLAMTLVIGLVLFCGVALFLSDTGLRNVLIGGLAASTGTAIAFYFSSKSADQARQDVLQATFGTETVPDLQGCTRDEALTRLGQTSLRLVVGPTSSTAAGAVVDSQVPPKDSQVRKGSPVVVTLVDGGGPGGGGQPLPAGGARPAGGGGQPAPAGGAQPAPRGGGQPASAGGAHAAAGGGGQPLAELAFRPPAHPVRITVDGEHPGPVVPADFAGLSFERGPLAGGDAGVSGNLFSPANTSLVTLFQTLGLGSLRIGGGTVDQLIPAGTGSDGFTGIDELFAFAAATGVKVVYSLRMLSPAADPIGDLKELHTQAAGHIWGQHREHVASFAIGNEPDWHSYHSCEGHPVDPAIVETVPGVPGSAYSSYLAHWRDLADAIVAAAPGALLSGPDVGAYTTKTYTPDPSSGVSWTEQLARDEKDSGRIAEVTQHYYVGDSPGNTTAPQAISNMLSREWVTATAIGTQPEATTYTPYPWLYDNNLAPVLAAGLRYRLTESNDYLGGVQGASDAFASALWALDHLHWWAAHGAAGVNFHNRRGLYTATIVPDPASPGAFTVNPKAYGIKAFTLGSAGRVKPVRIQNPDGVNVTAYCTGGEGVDYVTVINKAHGANAGDAAVTIIPPSPGVRAVEIMILAGGQPGDARGDKVTLGGVTITGDTPWSGTWSPLPAGPQPGISLTVQAATAAIVKIQSRG